MRRSEQEPVDPQVRNRYERMWPALDRDGGDGSGPAVPAGWAAQPAWAGQPWEPPAGSGPGSGPPESPRDERLWSDLTVFGDPWDVDAGPDRSGRPASGTAGSPDEGAGWPEAGDPGASTTWAGGPGASTTWAGGPGASTTWAGGPGAPGPGAGGSVSTVGAQALAALSPGRRGVRALAVLALAVVLVAAFLAWRSRPQTVAVPTVSTQPLPPAPAGAGTPAVSPVPSSALLVVAVEGRVRHPGLVRLPPGSRVADALAAAGGALPGTDLSFVNLARKVADGELIVIGMTPPPGTETGATAAPGGPAAGGIVDLNTATAADLDTLPGIGPALAQRILDYRAQHGGFHSVDELRNVPGIGDAKFAQLKDLVTV